MTEQQQMIERLEAIEKRKANAAFGSKMWLKSDDDAQIEEDLPTLLTLIREQQGEIERLRQERDEARDAAGLCPKCGAADVDKYHGLNSRPDQFKCAYCNHGWSKDHD